MMMRCDEQACCKVDLFKKIYRDLKLSCSSSYFLNSEVIQYL